MPRGDAVQTRPTLEQEMASFKGFSTKDGEVADGNQTADETAALAADEAARTAAAAVAAKNTDKQVPVVKKETPVAGAAAAAVVVAPVELTPEEETAAIEAAQTAAGDTELTEDEKDAAVAAALEEKNKTVHAAKPAKKTAEQRIGDITKRYRQTERALELERLGRENDRAEFERRLAALEKSEKPGATAGKTGEVPPDPKDFEYGELDVKYIKALARFEAKQEIANAATSQKETQLTAEQERERAAFEGKREALEEKGTEKYPDFDEVVIQTRLLPPTDPDFWPCSETLGRLMLDSAVGVDIAYHLASNPKEAREMFSKPSMVQAAYFGRLEAKFSSASSGAAAVGSQTVNGQSAAAAAKTTKAPPVPATRARGQNAKNGTAPETTDFASFEALAMGRRK